MKNFFSKKSVKKIDNFQKGYTIIETMIAVSLFIIIIMSGMGALLNANLIHQKTQNVRSVMDNLNFVLEDMSKNLRTGYNYHCLVSGEDILPTSSLSIAKSCVSLGWGVGFEYASGDINNDNDQWVYYIDNGKLYKSTEGSASLGNFVQLTPDEIVLDPDTSGFIVSGAESPEKGDVLQPIVTIRLSGTITFKNLVTPFSLQTSVSQRVIDI